MAALPAIAAAAVTANRLERQTEGWLAPQLAAWQRRLAADSASGGLARLFSLPCISTAAAVPVSILIVNTYTAARLPQGSALRWLRPIH